MKKTLSIFLAFVMLISCFGIFQVSAAESGGIADMLYSEETIAAAQSALAYFKTENLPAHFDDFNEFRKSSDWDEVSLMGISLDFLYEETRPLLWSELDVYKKNEDGKLVYGPDGLPVMLISKDDISLAFTNIGLYLQRLLYKEYGGLNMYTVDNAVAIANLLGKMFYPDFVELDANNYRGYFTNEVPSANEFYRGAVKLSGLDKIIDANWITRGRNFCEPVVEMLGGSYIDFFDEYYDDGLILGSKILEAMVKKLISVGPVDFAYDLINSLTSASYGITYRTPILALFTHKVSVIGSYITESEMKTFDGLLQLAFCNAECYSSKPSAKVKFCPLDFPTERFAGTTDKNEALIYLYYYLNLCGRYKDNGECFNNMKLSVELSTKLSAEDKIKLVALIDGFLLGDFSKTVDDAIIPLYKENISTASGNLFERMKNALMTFLKKIADYFDYLRRLFKGEIDYGQGNSPFN